MSSIGASFELLPFEIGREQEMRGGGRRAAGGSHAGRSRVTALRRLASPASPASAHQTRGRHRHRRHFFGGDWRGWDGVAGPVDGAPAVGFGVPSEQIRWVQFALNNALGANLPIDGLISAGLRAALKDFQGRQGLPVSGFVGPDTIAALQGAGGPPPSAAAPPPDAAAPSGEVSQFQPEDRIMHMPNCNCPACRAAAQNFEFENFEFGQSQELLGEQEELELAMELLHVRNDQELEQFLGDVFKSVGRGLKAVGSFAAKKVFPVLGPVLKQVAKAALPIAGGALGSLIPIPGVGTALGGALGGALANALEMEGAGLNQEEAALERARRFVRLAATAIQNAATALGSEPPESVARAALLNAARVHLPAAAGAAAAIAGQAEPGLRGTWRRHRDRIVVEGL